jgi:hypothetical protein
MLTKNQQLKDHSEETQKNEQTETQHKVPQMKVHTNIRSGTCVWDPDCEKYWCF